MLTLGIVSVILGSILILVVNPQLHEAHIFYCAYKGASKDPDISEAGQHACQELAKEYRLKNVFYHASRIFGYFLLGLGGGSLSNFILF